jgi:hypothetical protein
MALKQIDLHALLSPIEFLIPELVPYGYITFIASREGVGKTTALTGLAWQMTRPNGAFLGHPVARGPVIYLNTDAADGQSRPVRFWLEQHQATYPDGNMSDVDVYENTGVGLSPEEFKELLAIAEKIQARCIIIDSFMGTFPGIDGNKLDAVMLPMQFLRDFAARTGAAVIVTDHLPKRAAGEKDGDRGVMGSTGKTAQARAVHLLTRVAPKEVDGRDVLRWEVRKSSFARSGYAFGVEMERTFDDEGRPTTVHLTPYDLPEEDSSQDTRSSRATTAVTSYLEASEGAEIPLGALIAVAIERGNLQDRAARDAVKRALGLMWDRIEELKLPGQGAPKAYRLKVSPDVYASTAANTPESMQDELLFVAAPICQSSETATVQEELEVASW